MATTPASQGYQGFGSFHSDNVEDMISAVAHGAWDGPGILEFEQAILDSHPPPAGGLLSAEHLCLDPAWTFLNHGAFGAPAQVPMQVAEAWRRRFELQPLRAIDRWLFPLLVRTLQTLSAELHADIRSLALVPNATTGLNAAFGSLPLGPGDVVAYLDIAYGSVKKMLAEYTARASATLHCIHVPLAAGAPTPAELVELVRAALPPGCTTLVLDHITSNTALTLPILDIAAAARAAGVAWVVVDGAHALGAVPLDAALLASAGITHYVTNAHKWYCAPRGVAVLYVPEPAHRAALKSPIISHGWDAGFASGFIWDGARDYAAALAVPVLAAWWEQAGGVLAVSRRAGELLQQAVQHLCSAWGTRAHARDLSMYSRMALVGLPEAAIADGELASQPERTSTHAKLLQDALYYQHRIEVPVKCIAGQLYVRISAGPAAQMRDFDALRKAVLGMVEAGGVRHAEVDRAKRGVNEWAM